MRSYKVESLEKDPKDVFFKSPTIPRAAFRTYSTTFKKIERDCITSALTLWQFKFM